MIRPAVAMVLTLCTLLSAATAQLDTRQAARGLIREIRALQNADGSYGLGFTDTCRVLDLLTRSPDGYNELDGPFFRRAAQLVARAETAGDADRLGWQVLALAGVVTSELRERRDQAWSELSARTDLATSEPALLAWRTMSERPLDLPAVPAVRDVALRCLLAEDPREVEPPPLDDERAWVRWARAARLRGVRPQAWPDPGSPTASEELRPLLDALDLVVSVHGLAGSQTPPEPSVPDFVEAPQDLEQARERALAWLHGVQQGGQFGLELPGWSGPEPGVTALCLAAVIRLADQLERPRPAWVDEGLDALKGFQRPSGAIMSYGVAVYTTSVALEALIEGDRPQDREAAARALQYLVLAQADEGEGYDPDQDPHYGGVGYGGDERPDLSNTQIAIEAAARAGLPQDDTFFRKALVFLERNQNLTEVAALEWPRPRGGVLVSGHDGGATYMPGNSPAGEDEVGPGRYVARSYGSMTYALTKSYVLCGRSPDDRRVQAAVRWLGDHFTVTQNPGFPESNGGDGLYYYYLAMARTLSRLPEDALANDEGQVIDWREELVGHLLGQQRVDGSWVNAESARWYESSPTLCTAYAILALAAAQP